MLCLPVLIAQLLKYLMENILGSIRHFKIDQLKENM